MTRIPALLRAGHAIVADNATIAGDVTLGKDVSIWYGTVVRGDVAPIRIGDRTNVQDLVMVHPEHDEDVVLGAEITVGHAAVVHGREVGDGCLLGIRSVLLRGSRVGRECIIGACALVPEGRIIPPRSVVVGVPGRVVRQVTDDEALEIRRSASRYVQYALAHVRA